MVVVCSTPLMSTLIDVIPMGLGEAGVIQYKVLSQGVDQGG